MFELRTKRLLLRDFCEDDLVPYQKSGCHPEVLKYYPHNVEEWQVHAAELVKMFIKRSHEAPRLFYSLAIVVDGAFAGTVSVRTESVEQRQGSMGCGLAHDYWSKGYALEAMQAAITLGFETLDLHRIYAETISENAKAIALAERAGLRIEGEFKECQYFKDRWWNKTVLAILRSEWQKVR